MSPLPQDKSDEDDDDGGQACTYTHIHLLEL